MYVFIKLAQDCDREYYESAIPYLKAAFTFVTFFASFEFEGKHLWCTIVTLLVLCAICIGAYFNAKTNLYEAESNKVEIIFSCIEYFWH